jgi:hypothetical protein
VSFANASTSSADRSVLKPGRPSGGGCTCIARADADDTMPGNLKPEAALFAFASATAADCPTASREAKRLAIGRLGMKPKHVKTRCSG